MTHWYREPKRVKLMEHLERSGIGFVLCSEGFSEIDLDHLKALLQPSNLADRLSLGSPAAGDGRKVLITARLGEDPNWFRNPEPWAGIFILSGHRHLRDKAFRDLFSINRSFPNGARGRRAVSKGVLQRFVLDMRAQPPSLYGLREATEPLGCQE